MKNRRTTKANVWTEWSEQKGDCWEVRGQSRQGSVMQGLGARVRSWDLFQVCWGAMRELEHGGIDGVPCGCRLQKGLSGGGKEAGTVSTWEKLEREP